MVRIRIGAIEVEYDHVIQPRELRALMKFVASIAVAMRDEGAEEEPEEDNRPTVSLGFTTEIAPPIEIDLSEYFEEEDSTGRNN